MKKKKLHWAWVVLAGVIFIRGFAGGGLNTVSSLFLPSVAEELHIGMGSLSLYLSITAIVTVLWLPFAGKLLNRYDVRLVALGGMLLQTLSFAGFGLMNHVYGWYLLGAPYAMGATILANLLGPILIHRWFAKNAGLMMGLQMAFVGGFGAVFQPFTSGLIAQKGWRAAYIILGCAALTAILIAILGFLKNKPEEKGLLPYGRETAPSAPAEKKKIEERKGISERAAVRSASFYLLLLFMIAITGVGVFSQHIPTYGGLLGYPIQRIGTALAFASVGSAAGSVAIGLISDRIGVLKTCYGVIGFGLMAVAGFFLSKNSFFIFGLSAFLHGLTSSGIMVLAPILTLKFYGEKDYEKIYAKISMGAPIASILLIPAYGFIYDWTKSYGFVLAGMTGLLFAALLCMVMSWRKRYAAMKEETDKKA